MTSASMALEKNACTAARGSRTAASPSTREVDRDERTACPSSPATPSQRSPIAAATPDRSRTRRTCPSASTAAPNASASPPRSCLAATDSKRRRWLDQQRPSRAGSTPPREAATSSGSAQQESVHVVANESRGRIAQHNAFGTAAGGVTGAGVLKPRDGLRARQQTARP